MSCKEGFAESARAVVGELGVSVPRLMVESVLSGIETSMDRRRMSEVAGCWRRSRTTSTSCSTGLELLDLNDADACAQLDGLSEAVDLQRDSITIKPRVGWQGDGYPDGHRTRMKAWAPRSAASPQARVRHRSHDRVLQHARRRWRALHLELHLRMK